MSRRRQVSYLNDNDANSIDDALQEPLLQPTLNQPQHQHQDAPSPIATTTTTRQGCLNADQSSSEESTAASLNNDSTAGAGVDDDDSNSILIVDGLQWHISYLIKSLYFFEALNSSTWGRFGTIYYNLHKMNSYQIGTLEATMTIIPIAAIPLWGLISDLYKCRKVVYIVTKVAGTITILSLALPQIYNSHLNIFVMSCTTKLFVQNILDSYTLDMLGTSNQRLYGRYRLYASLSWGFGAFIMGMITDTLRSFEPNFIIYGVLGFVCLLLVVFGIPSSEIEEKHQREQQEQRASEQQRLQQVSQQEEADAEDVVITSSIITDVADTSLAHFGDGEDEGEEELYPSIWNLLLLCRPRVVLFLIQVVVMGAGMATVDRLLFLYMVNDLQSSTTLCGITVLVNVLFEIPIFWYATWFLHHLGLDGMQILSMLCLSVRLYGYTVLTPATVAYGIIPLEILHGITFACYWTVATDVSKSLIHQTIPEGSWNTTIPSIVQMLQSGVGVSIGSGLGGYVMHKYGSRFMYRGMAIIVFCMLMIQIIGSTLVRIIPASSSSGSREDDNDVDENGMSHSSGREHRSFLPDYTHKHTMATTTTTSRSTSTTADASDDVDMTTTVDNAQEREVGPN